jgi:hypothetical protein
VSALADAVKREEFRTEVIRAESAAALANDQEADIRRSLS